MDFSTKSSGKEDEKKTERYGIRHGYPRLRRYFGKITAYVQLIRAFTLVAPLIAGIFGVLAPVKTIDFNHVIVAVYVGITLALAQGMGQCLNQYADVEMDRVSKSYRPLPMGLVSREEALGVSWLLGIFAIGRAFTISTFFGLVTLLLIFFAVFYSLAPFSPRRVNAFLNLGWMAISRGLIPVFAVWSVYGNLSDALLYSLLALVWMLGFQGTKDIVDAEVDKKFGIKTVVNTFDIEGLKVTMWTCLIIYAILATLFNKFWMLLLVPIGVVCIFTNERKLGFMENVTSWVLMYLGLGLFYVLMFVQAKI